MTYILYNIVPLGFILLLIFMFADIFLDYFRKTQKEYKRRVFVYSWIFYLLSLFQIKSGGLTLPPQDFTNLNTTFIPTGEWFGIYDTLYLLTSNGHPLSLFYNIVLFIPFGIYLSALFNMNRLKRIAAIVILGCIGIELVHLLLESIGLVMRSYNLQKIGMLTMNIFGGIFGSLLVVFIRLKSKNLIKDAVG